MAEIKFCGLTRAEDARFASAIGAAYLGVIFAGGPRTVAPDRARVVLDAAEPGALRVGVFGVASPGEIARTVERARLEVVQLHGDPTAEDVETVRSATGVKVWAVVRVTHTLPVIVDELLSTADALLIDARVEGSLGGSGVPVEWRSLAPDVARRRGAGMIVLAGGLVPDNVATALAALQPDVVDVSSGVESSPGIKDHARMRAFAAAVAGAAQERK